MKGKSALSLFDTYVSERSAGRVSQLFLYKPTYSIAKNLAFLIHKSRSASTSLSIAARNFDNFFERFSYIYSNSRQMLKFASRIQASKKEVAWFMLNDRVGILYSRPHHVLPSVALFCKFFLTSFTNKLIHRVSYSSRRVRSFPRGAFFVDPKLITVYSLVFRLNTIALLYVRANINPSLHVLVKALLKTTLLKIVYLLVSRSKAGIHKPLALSLQLRNFFYSRALFLLQHSRLSARNVSRLLVRYVLSYTAFMCRRPKIFTRPRLSTRKLDLKSRLTYKFKLAQSAILLAEARKQTKGVRTATYNAQQFFTNYAKVRAHYIFKLKTF